MGFSKFIHSHRLLIHYITLLIVLLGVASLFLLQREARPNVNFNRVTIQVAYPGAAPSDIEKLIIDPIEEKLAEVDGVEEYRSVSYTGAGSIMVMIDDTYPNPEEIVDEVRRKVSEVKKLPAEVEDPVVIELKASNIPVISVALFGDVAPFQFKMATEKLKDYLQRQEGVQSITISGVSDLQLQVRADEKKLRYYDLTFNEILSKLSTWSRQKPGGLFENEESVINVTVGKDVTDIAAMEDFVVRSNDSGKEVKLKQVADIDYQLESQQSGSLFKDKTAVLLTVVKKPFSDSIRVVDSIKKSLEQYKPHLDKGLQIEVYNDQSIRIRNKLKIVLSNALTGLFLVLFILLFFLDWRSSLVTSVGIPVAVLGGVTLLYFFGHTLNSLVVVGMIIVLGMLVDDAIVVCENIYAYLEKGMTPLEAALKGTAEIARPVIASVLTTVLAFFPVIFMEGIMGQFLSVIPITVVIMLMVSLFEALIILPVHAEEVMRPKKKEKKNIFVKFEKVYKKYLFWSIKRRWFIVAFLFLFSVLSVFQGKKIFSRFSLFPAEGLTGLSVRVELPKNSPLNKTKEKVMKLTSDLLAVSDDTFENIISTLGQVRTGGMSGSLQNGGHLAMVNISFISDKVFAEKEKQVVADIMKVVAQLKKEKGVLATVTLDRPGPPIGKPIQLQVTARDQKKGEKIIQELTDQLKKINGVHSIVSDLDGDSVNYRFNIDRSYASSEGVEIDKISRTLFSATTGVIASEILKNNEKVEVLLTLNKESKKSISDILNLRVRNKSGQAVPLRSFVEIVEERAASTIQRLNGLRTMTLFAEVDDKVITGKEANMKIRPFLKELKMKNQTVKIEAGGGEKDRMNALKDTMRLYLLAILLIFITISLTFNSFIYPFLVLSSIPMGIGGVIWSLLLHGKPLTLMGIIGLIGLSGVVVNVSIIFLKFIQDRIRLGMPFQEAIVDAGMSRLRPIVITTITTLIGLAPTIYGIGGVDTFVQPIALVLGWGLFVATLLTLLCLPALISFFSILGRFRNS